MWTANLICATNSEEEQCVLLLSRQAQTHACQDALSGLGHIQQAHMSKDPVCINTR